ncbi:C40 family peptidase [Marinobacter bohaiensis]|uniref:hypothetical protein n=1 Tax=Marinobacter bohaiensis TaxID=2201898 RepID=UPI000DADD437|nr:hypothetical protein [Marinobacter bohaiensis]
MITLQFSTTKGIGSQVIRWATWSPYSHVDLVLADGRLLGATARYGVSIRNPEPTLACAQFQVPGSVEAIEAARSQIGRPYDWAGILGWGFRRNWQEQDAWFCSELIAWAFEQAGCPLLRGDRSHRITPRDLLLSPMLVPTG